MNYQNDSDFSFQSICIDFNYFPEQKAHKFDYGFNLGFEYSQSQLGLSCDSLNDVFATTNDLGDYLHYVSGSRINQSATVRSLTVPILFNIKFKVSKSMFFDLLLGPEFGLFACAGYSDAHGLFKHKGFYNFQFPDGSSIDTFIEDVEYYGFSDYESVPPEETKVNTIFLSGCVKLCLSKRISSNQPLFLNLGANFHYGFTDTFITKSLVDDELIAKGGEMSNMFGGLTKGNIQSFGFNIGIQYHFKEKRQ